jgi:hypothetical protein
MKDQPLSVVLCSEYLNFNLWVQCWSENGLKAVLFVGKVEFTSRNINSQSNIVDAK